jgi:hypothetical protein
LHQSVEAIELNRALDRPDTRMALLVFRATHERPGNVFLCDWHSADWWRSGMSDPPLLEKVVAKNVLADLTKRAKVFACVTDETTREVALFPDRQPKMASFLDWLKREGKLVLELAPDAAMTGPRVQVYELAGPVSHPEPAPSREEARPAGPSR